MNGNYILGLRCRFLRCFNLVMHEALDGEFLLEAMDLLSCTIYISPVSNFLADALINLISFGLFVGVWHGGKKTDGWETVVQWNFQVPKAISQVARWNFQMLRDMNLIWILMLFPSLYVPLDDLFGTWNVYGLGAATAGSCTSLLTLCPIHQRQEIVDPSHLLHYNCPPPSVERSKEIDALSIEFLSSLGEDVVGVNWSIQMIELSNRASRLTRSSMRASFLSSVVYMSVELISGFITLWKQLRD